VRDGCGASGRRSSPLKVAQARGGDNKALLDSYSHYCRLAVAAERADLHVQAPV
jgi:hypothetical protein